jgi:hypothetical protein
MHKTHTWALFGIDPAAAVTTAATLSLHGGELHRVIAVGNVLSTTALSDAGITLGLSPVVKQIGKRPETELGMAISFGAERNFGARAPIFTPKSQNAGQPSPHSFPIVRITSLHA